MSSPLVAMVSGGSSGIGQAFVEELHRRGYRVLFCGRDPKKLRFVESRCPGTRGLVCDVADKASVLALASSVLAENPCIDLLISNAGGSHEIDFNAIDAATADLSSDIRINLEGNVNLIAAFLPGLRKAKSPALLVVTSGYALAPASRAPLYSAAKAGLRSFTKALRYQLEPSGILVTELAPPVVDTPSVAHRKVPKLPVDGVVNEALAAMAKGKTVVYPGAVRWLPLLLRLAPSFAERMVART